MKVSHELKPMLRRLRRLDVRRRAGFAAAAAQRLLPMLRRFHGSSPDIDLESLIAALDSVWAFVMGRSERVEVELGPLEAQYPDDQVPQWLIEFAYLQNAVGAVLYAVDASRSRHADDALRAAWQLLELAEYLEAEPALTLNEVGLAEESGALAAFRADPISTVRAALEGDLMAVEALAPDYQELAERADHEGALWASALRSN